MHLNNTASKSVEVAVDCKDNLGEGTFFDQGKNELWWISIPPTSCIHRLDISTGKVDTWEMPEMVSYAVRTKSPDKLLVASHGGLNSFDPATGRLERIRQVETMRPFNRCNDACCDLQGNLWVGTMQNNVAPDGSDIKIVSNTGSLYRVDEQLNVVEKETGFGISNSCCFAPDGKTLYSCDTLQEVIWAYDLDLDSGAISNRRDFAVFERGLPDGATVDEDGCVWSSRFDGACVVRFTPDGKVDAVIEMPTPKITCCTFGGDALDTLYITTAKIRAER